jgi:hypothetical protein
MQRLVFDWLAYVTNFLDPDTGLGVLARPHHFREIVINSTYSTTIHQHLNFLDYNQNPLSLL